MSSHPVTTLTSISGIADLSWHNISFVCVFFSLHYISQNYDLYNFHSHKSIGPIVLTLSRYLHHRFLFKLALPIPFMNMDNIKLSMNVVIWYHRWIWMLWNLECSAYTPSKIQNAHTWSETKSWWCLKTSSALDFLNQTAL